MTQRPVLFVGYKDQDNLGLGYMAAVLAQNGFDSDLADFRSGEKSILARVRETDPLLIGLSIIFQYFTPDFANLVTFLRGHGVNCPICAGGHYPSLRYEEVLAAIPALDCVIRFEGEFTLLEMAQRVAAGQDWHDLPSIAYRSNDGVTATPLRPLIADLDGLPFPRRWNLDIGVFGLGGAPILASRGCPRSCSFCSIRKFYSIPPGKIRRARSPANVVAEMREMFDHHNTRLFMFQDDDFPLLSSKDRAWATEFVERIEAAGLGREVMWKISCRADEIEPETFRVLQRGGLFTIYLGLESGNPRGLATLNKQISVEQNIRSVETLKELGLNFEFGFMLFDPSSTFDSVLENVAFLRKVCGDGSSPAVFSRMAPYAGTDIEEQLIREGRLLGRLSHLSYTFHDPHLEDWFRYLYPIFESFAMGRDSLVLKLRAARVEIATARHFWPELPGLYEYDEAVRGLAAWYNEIYCRIVEDSAPHFRQPTRAGDAALNAIRQAADEQHHWLDVQLNAARTRFLDTTPERWPDSANRQPETS